MSLSKKVIFVSIIAILLPSITMIFYNYNQTITNFTIEVQKNEYQTLLQIKENILWKINTVSNISANLSLDYELQKFLKRDFIMNTENILEYMDHMIPKFIHAEGFYRQLIDSVTLYITNTSIPEQARKLYHENRIIDFEWYKEFKKSGDDYIWLYPQKSLLFESNECKEGNTFFTLVKKIFSPGGNYLGIIAISINRNVLLPITYTIDGTQEMIIVDKNSNILVQNHQLLYPERDEYINNLLNNRESNYLIDEGLLYTYVIIEPLEITIISRRVLKQLMKKPWNSNTSMIVIIICGVFMSTLFTVIMIRVIFMRLGDIVKIMETIGNGRFDTFIPIESEDEIGLISRDFNRLITKINEQVNEILKMETEQKNAQIMALQYQINPHFLYNTIELFKSKMELAGEYEIAEAIVDFAEMFRYNISHDSMYTTINYEINHVKNYVNIQKVRYDGQIDLKIDMPKEILEREIIRFIFQPIVENSIKHGMDSSNPKLNIIINAEIKRQNLVIVISNDGLEIEQNVLEKLNKKLENSCEQEDMFNSSNNIGLQNINNRIKLFYGDNYYIQLACRKGKYTSTIITLPYI